MGGDPAGMFDEGIAALGGIKTFVKKGQVVVIKPNISWNSPVERGATTNPLLVGRIVEHCIDAGAKKVYVFDNTINSWHSCYKSTGIEEAVKNSGGQMAPAHSKSYYQQISVPGAKILKTAMVHELVMEADVFINVPVLKHHGSTRMTAALKNLMGAIWDRQFYHASGLSQCIAEFPLLRKPALSVIDAYTVMTSGGPQGSSYRAAVEIRKMQILSPDMVAADSAAAKVMGLDPDDIRYITMASDLRLGTKNLDSLSIKRITL
ncbi:MAG: DUF362 domain-containing protein [Spirochaetia bacterium]|jgi:uncharacterized protein (DUF362 family)|nr:DUF362 domain-containing protein [Spirochaetia bacterium]